MGKVKFILRYKIALVVTLLAICGAFLGGVWYAENTRPEIDQVSELYNKYPSGSSTAKTEICIDESTGKVALCAPENTDEDRIDFEPFWKAWNIINEKYVSADGPNNQEKVFGAIGGLVASLGDPYSFFLPPQEASMFEQDVAGYFGGVGMHVGMRDNVLTVISPLKGTPAESAGVLAGDQIIEIDEEPTFDMSVDEAVYKIRGEVGTVVKLGIYREGEDEPIEIEVTRDTINIPVMDTELRDDGVFVISLYSFSGTAPTLFRDALREFVETGSSKLVIDLRGNPGGYLEVAVDMASWFLEQGKVVVREDQGRNGEGKTFRSVGYNLNKDVFHGRIKMVVLVDRGSASASEIFAGALREHGIALLVGQKTFGKGSVQELVPLTEDTSIKLTVARWLTPKGVSISENGIVPDFEVEYTKEDAEAKHDPQMEKAVEVLENWSEHQGLLKDTVAN